MRLKALEEVRNEGSVNMFSPYIHNCLKSENVPRPTTNAAKLIKLRISQ